MLSPGDEAKQMITLNNGEIMPVLSLLERQFNVLYTRSQILVSLAGVVITVTGFSGRLIASTDIYAQIFVISGLLTVLASAIYINFAVMTIRWNTSDPLDDPEAGITEIVERRNRKTSAYRIGGKILLIGMLFYCVAISIMLLFPTPVSVPVR